MKITKKIHLQQIKIKVVAIQKEVTVMLMKMTASYVADTRESFHGE